MKFQAKELNTMLGEVIVNSVGKNSMNILCSMGPEKDLLKRSEQEIAERTKMALEKNKLLLEKILVI